MKKQLLTLILLIGALVPIRATHILGGYINYTHDSANTYTIHLFLYRDCNSQTPFDGSAGAAAPYAILGLYDNNDSLFNTLHLTNPEVTTVFPPQDSTCIFPAPFCLEVGKYTTRVTLNPLTDILLVYQRCCFSFSVANIFDAGNKGYTVTAKITGNNVSPVFNLTPPLFVGVNHPFSFSNWCSDPDGDSLAFSLVTPLSGGNPNNPSPDPPFGPPFDTLRWQNGYDALHPLGQSATFEIDSITGAFSGIPNTVGSFLVGVKVSEFRNGQLLAEYPLNFTLNVTSCDYHPDTTTGVANTLMDEINVYPNPAKDRLVIEGLPYKDCTIRLTDMLGRLMIEEKLPPGNQVVGNLNRLAPGTYLLQVNGRFFKRISIE